MPEFLPYSTLDVFAERAYQGNALAVFHDARGLSCEQMQTLARETNLSETTFVVPGDAASDRADGIEVRIFTPQEELPFAGHPTLGTATWLRLHHPAFTGAETVRLRLKAGTIPVRFAAPEGATEGLYGTMRQRDPEFGPEFEPGEVAAILGLPGEALLPGWKPQIVSTGNAFCIVPLRDPGTLRALAIPQGEARRWLRSQGARWFYCLAADPAAGLWRARMQWENGEDPATGSAAGPAIAWLVRTGLVASGQATTLLQGVEILRPSRLHVQARCIDGAIREVEVGGRTIPVATGRFLCPPPSPFTQEGEPGTPIIAGVPDLPVDSVVNNA